MDATHLRIIIGDDEPAAAEAIRCAFDAAEIAVEIKTDTQGDIGLLRDITARKQTEDALRGRVEELAALQATVLDIAAQHDLPTLLHTIVERAAQLLGARSGGMYLCDPGRGEVRCVVSYNTPHDYTGTILAYGEGAASPAAIAVENTRLYEEAQTEIAERKRAEAALRESETRFRLLTELVSDYAYELRIRPDGTPRGEWLTESFTSMFGYSLAENQARGGLFSIVLPEDLPIATEHFQRVAAGNADVTEMRFVTRGGETRWLRDYARPVWDDAGQKVTRIFGAAQDITEHKRVEEATTTERSLLRTLVDNLPDSVYVKDLAGRKTLANPADIRKMGVASAAEALGKTDFEVFPPDLAAIFDADDQHVIQTGQPVLNREERFILPDGSQGWQLTAKVPLRDRAGQVIGLIGIGHDITERKQAEAALRESEEHYRDLVENSQDLICTHDMEGRVLTANPSAARLLGYDLNELIGSNLRDHLASEVRSHFKYYINRLKRKGAASGHLIVQTKTGERRIWEYNNTVRVAGVAQPIVRGMARDVTERMQAEATLRESKRRFREMLENVDLIAVMLDVEGRVTFCNDSLLRLIERKRADVLGQNWFAMFVPPELHVEDAFKAKIEQGTISAHYENDILTASGERRLISWSNTVLRDFEGRVIGTTSIGEDITDRQRAEDALREREQSLTSIYNTVGDVIFQLAVEKEGRYRFTSVNRTFLTTTGLTSAQVVGKRMDEVIPEPSLSMVLEKYAAAIREKEIVHWEEISEYPTGRLTGEVSIAPVFDATGNCTHLVGAVHDITARKRAEEVLRENETRGRLSINNMLEAYALHEAIFDENGRMADYRFLEFNPAAQKISNIARKDIVGRTALELYPHVVERGLLDRYADVMTTGEPAYIEDFYYAGDSLDKAFDISCFRIDTRHFVCVFRDITERKRAEEEREKLLQEVQRAREQLQVLSRRLVEVQEIERRHIARELHDEVGQLLTGLKMLLETNSHLPADTLRSRLSNAQSLVEQLLEQVQGMSLDLRPTMLDDLGLLPALLWFAKRFADQTGVRVHLEHAGLDRRFASEIETAVYRIVQEALTNVARHADVKEAIARLWATQDTLHVQVEDRGKGFHVQAALVAPISSGLSGMRERAVALGGNLMIESTLGVGTHVVLEVPLNGSLERKTKEGRE